jgi:REP element-mobilizing transposase RayT
MARANRRDVLVDQEVQVVHCINRCVRRAFLCGDDKLTGKNYDQRRELIRQRLEFLAGVMGIEVLGYAVMSNHFHCVLRSRHDVVATWSDDEVARKWWMLCPALKNPDGSPAEPTEVELKAIRNDRKGLKEKRRRLSSISWFMRFLSEKIAKDANKDDKCTGRFWEGRFKAQVLLDEAAILACMQYVDLNPIRAGLAKTLEGSDFTSVQDRIEDLKQAKKECADTSAQCAESVVESVPCSEQTEQAVPSAALAEPATIPAPARNAFDAAMELGARAGWLSPIALQPKRQAVRAKKTERRASNKGFLSLGVGEYLQLLDWTARQVRSDKRGAMPAELEPLFERLQISAELWVDCVENFHKWFRSSVGRPKSMATHADAQGHNRAISITSSRRVFV